MKKVSSFNKKMKTDNSLTLKNIRNVKGLVWWFLVAVIENLNRNSFSPDCSGNPLLPGFGNKDCNGKRD